MGDFYDFEIRMIDGKEVSGFCYQNEKTGWNEVFVQFTDKQLDWAKRWQERADQLNNQQVEMIRLWISR